MLASSAYENAVKKARTRTNNKPGTMSMALIVSPVIVRVRFISVGGAAAIIVLLLEHSGGLHPIDGRPVAAVPEPRIDDPRPEISIATATLWRHRGCAWRRSRLLPGCALEAGRERTRRARQSAAGPSVKLLVARSMCGETTVTWRDQGFGAGSRNYSVPLGNQRLSESCAG